jgi:pimeloyl-ACP methyl ester carboxylesterase
MTDPSPLRASTRPCCEVHVAGYVIQYRRFGTGARRAVYVASNPLERSEWSSVVGLLVLQHRLYAPLLQPAFQATFADTLRGFMDGVGADSATLIAADPWCQAALDFANAEPDRVERLILIPSDQAAATRLEKAMGQTTLSAVVLPRDRAEPAMLEALSLFLDSAPRAP